MVRWIMDDLSAYLERDIFEMFLFPSTLSHHLHTMKGTLSGWEVLLEVRAAAGMVHLYSCVAFTMSRNDGIHLSCSSHGKFKTAGGFEN